MKDTSGPAFPTDGESQVGPNTWHHEGMTLRDYFAAKAMQGTISNAAFVDQLASLSGNETVAIWAYAQADAMLKAREQ